MGVSVRFPKPACPAFPGAALETNGQADLRPQRTQLEHAGTARACGIRAGVACGRGGACPGTRKGARSPNRFPSVQRRGQARRLDSGGTRQGARHHHQSGCLLAHLDCHSRCLAGSRAAGDRGSPVKHLPPRALQTPFLRLAGGQGSDLRPRRQGLRACARGHGGRARISTAWRRADGRRSGRTKKDSDV